MAQTSYLKKRGAIFYAQIPVPRDIQHIITGKTKERSLKTKDLKEAKRLLPAFVSEWQQKFADAKTGEPAVTSVSHRLTNAQMAMRLYQSQVEFDGEIRAVDFRYAEQGVDPGAAKDMRDGYSGHLNSNDLNRVVGDWVELYRQKGYHNYQRFGHDWRKLAMDLCAAMYETFKRQDERDEGNFNGSPILPILVNADPEKGVSTESGKDKDKSEGEGEGVLDLFRQYSKENAKGIKQDTLKQGHRDVSLFVDAMAVKHVGGIVKKAVREWKALLLRYPVKAAEMNVFKGKTMQQIISANEKLQKPTISDGTVNRHLGSLGAFCNWLVRNGYLDKNPVEGLLQFVDKSVRRKASFTGAQLTTLFTSPLFAGCTSDRKWNTPGSHKVRDHRFWIPYIMLYAGARPAEIAQLLVQDVKKIHGHWVIHVTLNGDDEKSVKTNGSMRVIPVHSELVQMGFIDYHNEMSSAGETKLFPNAERNERGQMVADFSRDFNRYLSRIGLKNGRGLSLYSFRHGFIDALRRADYLDNEIGFLVGHTSHTMTAQYGCIQQGTLAKRVKMVAAVSYPDFQPTRL